MAASLTLCLFLSSQWMVTSAGASSQATRLSNCAFLLGRDDWSIAGVPFTSLRPREVPADSQFTSCGFTRGRLIVEVMESQHATKAKKPEIAKNVRGSVVKLASDPFPVYEAQWTTKTGQKFLEFWGKSKWHTVRVVAWGPSGTVSGSSVSRQQALHVINALLG
ncbi:MAG: hypothetical protein ACLP62_08470 [Acidimicrobiales bacterium]